MGGATGTVASDYIAKNNPLAALTLDDNFEAQAELARQQPKLYKPGRVKGTREIVVQANCVMVYRLEEQTLEILRILHARQQWPAHG